jgi:hypothetical protein
MNLFQEFDKLGMVAFGYLLVDALYDLRSPSARTWRTYVRMLIGIGGLFVDSYLVFFY